MQVERRKPLTAEVAVFSVGLDTYWRQFDGLLDELLNKTEVFKRKVKALNAEVVDFGMIDMESIPHFYFTNRMDRGTDCCCSNYLYNRDKKVLDIYHRNYSNFRYCESSLVYDGEFFRQGFHEDNVVW